MNSQRLSGRSRSRPHPGSREHPASGGAASAIVVAAGRSTRMGGKVRKPFLSLRGRPILSWTLAALARLRNLRECVIVIRPEDRRAVRRAVQLARLPKRVRVCFAPGGARRQDSVLNGLRASSPRSSWVLVHDAARPFPPPDAVRAALAAAARGGAAILALPVRDTVKRGAACKARATVGGALFSIEDTVPRVGLWLAQTPQVFARARILALFERLIREAPGAEVTDDAAVCERYGQPVALIESRPTNLKITRPEDLRVAEAYLRAGLVK